MATATQARSESASHNEELRLSNGVAPFAGDSALTYLTSAYSLLHLVSTAWEDATRVDQRSSIDPKSPSSEFFTISAATMDSAIGGIQTLIALAGQKMEASDVA